MLCNLYRRIGLLLLAGLLVSCDAAPIPPSPGLPSPTLSLPITPTTRASVTTAPTAPPSATSPGTPPPGEQPTGAPTAAPPLLASLPPRSPTTAPPGAPTILPVTPGALTPPRILATTDVPLSGGTSRFDYQSLDPQTGRLFIAHLGAGLVHVWDTHQNQIIATIPKVAGVHGVLAIPDLGQVYASATGDNEVAVIDEQTLQVVARIPGGTYPDGLAYDPATQQVFVSDETGATDTVIDVRTHQRLATIPLGGEAGNTQYDPGSGRMFVAVQSRNQLVALDPVARQVVGRYPLPGCDHDHGLLIDAPQRRAFVACDGNAKLLLVDLDSMQVLDVQTVGDDPDVLALDPSWHRLYVAAESGVLAIFDEQGGQIHKLSQAFFAPGAHSVAVDPATHQVYFPLVDIAGQPVLRIVQYAAP